MMIRTVGGWVFLLVPAHPGSPGQRAVKRSLCCCILAPNKQWHSTEDRTCGRRYPEDKFEFDKASLMTVNVPWYDNTLLRRQYVQVPECLQVISTYTLWQLVTQCTLTTYKQLHTAATQKQYLWPAYGIGQAIIFSSCHSLEMQDAKNHQKVAICAPSYNFVRLYLRN